MVAFRVSREVLEIILWSVARTIPQLIPVTTIIVSVLTLILTIPLISYHHFQFPIRIPIETAT